MLGGVIEQGRHAGDRGRNHIEQSILGLVDRVVQSLDLAFCLLVARELTLSQRRDVSLEVRPRTAMPLNGSENGIVTRSAHRPQINSGQNKSDE
jgi:hypothetical protein